MTSTTQTPSKSITQVFNMHGFVSAIELRTTKTGCPYTVCKFSTFLNGTRTTRVAMAFGKTHEDLQDIAAGEQNIYVKIEAGTLQVLGAGRIATAKVAA